MLMPLLRKGWLLAIGFGVVALLLAAALLEWHDRGGLSTRLTSHCKTFIASQPESRLTYPGGTVVDYFSNEGYKTLDEIDEPYSVAYIVVPAPQPAVDSWYQSWLEARGWSPFWRLHNNVDLEMTGSWERLKNSADNAPTASLEFASWPADKGGDASHPPDPSKAGITTVRLMYKVGLYQWKSNLCS